MAASYSTRPVDRALLIQSSADGLAFSLSSMRVRICKIFVLQKRDGEAENTQCSRRYLKRQSWSEAEAELHPRLHPTSCRSFSECLEN